MATQKRLYIKQTEIENDFGSVRVSIYRQRWEEERGVWIDYPNADNTVVERIQITQLEDFDARLAAVEEHLGRTEGFPPLNQDEVGRVRKLRAAALDDPAVKANVDRLAAEEEARKEAERQQQEDVEWVDMVGKAHRENVAFDREKAQKAAIDRAIQDGIVRAMAEARKTPTTAP